jgi:hypothetical protein
LYYDATNQTVGSVSTILYYAARVYALVHPRVYEAFRVYVLVVFPLKCGFIIVQVCMCCVSLSAPGLVQSLRVGSVDVTNITTQWDRVNCVDRNGRINSYFVFFYLTSSPSDRDAIVVLGTGDSDRMFSLTGLSPRTNYTFEVEAINPLIRDQGAIATITASTTAPLGELSYRRK